MNVSSRRQRRRATVAIETLFVMVSFVVASFVFMKLAALVMQVFFVDGSRLNSIPMF